VRKALVAGAGAVGAALLGSLCCMGPILFVTLGVGAGLAGTFEPLRPLFGVVMLGLFALAFYSVYAKRSERSALKEMNGVACTAPRGRQHEKLLLWIAAAVALVLWTFPTWSVWLV
jgi:mercuric ion transport protein